MPQDSSPILGIDLGTTMSAAAWFADGQVHYVRNDLDEILTPSVVALDPRTGSIVTGRIAKDLMAADPSCGAALFKRSMGVDDSHYTVGDRRFTPVELSAYILDALRRDAERALGLAAQRCVVTVPAYFSEAQRRATRQAAQVAGLSVERIVNEPTAAAIAYGLNEAPDEVQFVVLDLGGGTFDVCVMEYFDGLL
ncbi:MAG: Hsp70 family protein, partial [Pseudomonadota bacterium]